MSYLTVVYSSIAVTLAVLIEFRRRAEWKLIGLYGLGGIVGTLIWIALRLTPDWQLHPWLIWLPSSQGGQFSLMKLSVNLVEVIVTGFIGYSRLGGLESAYILAGLVGLLWRRQIQDRYVAFFWLILFMGDAVFRTGNHHLVYLMPISCLAIAAAIVSVANHLTQRRGSFQTSPAFIVGVLVGPMLLSYIGAGLYLAWQSRVINYGQYSSQLRSLVPAGANVFGEGTWWWALRDGLYTADDYLIISDAVPAGDTPSTLQSFLKARNVQAILLDERLGFSMTYTYRPDIYAALTDYAKTHCRLAGVVEGYAYGVEQGGPAIKRTEVFICPPP